IRAARRGLQNARARRRKLHARDPRQQAAQLPVVTERFVRRGGGGERGRSEQRECSGSDSFLSVRHALLNRWNRAGILAQPRISVRARHKCARLLSSVASPTVNRQQLKHNSQMEMTMTISKLLAVTALSFSIAACASIP